MTCYQINASLTCINLKNIESSINQINLSKIHSLHYDVVDGQFNHCFMFGDRMLPVFKELSTKPISVHLACKNPEYYIDSFAKNGADTLIIHYESDTNLTKTIQKIKSLGLKVSLGFCCDTEVPDNFLDLAKKVNSILKLTVYPGFSGQKFYTPALNHIKKMNKILESANIDCPIEVDGNINQHTIQDCVKAGATHFTGGSSGLFTKTNTLDENIDILFKKINEVDFYGNNFK